MIQIPSHILSRYKSLLIEKAVHEKNTIYTRNVYVIIYIFV
jgi:hypothetical protein